MVGIRLVGVVSFVIHQSFPNLLALLAAQTFKPLAFFLFCIVLLLVTGIEDIGCQLFFFDAFLCDGLKLGREGIRQGYNILQSLCSPVPRPP